VLRHGSHSFTCKLHHACLYLSDDGFIADTVNMALSVFHYFNSKN